MIRASAAALVAAVLAVLIRNMVDHWHPIIRGIVVLGAFGGAYAGAAHVLGVTELRDALNRIRRKA